MLWWSPWMVEVSQIFQLTSISVMGYILLLSKSELYFIYNFVNPDMYHKRNKPECKQVKSRRSLSREREFILNCTYSGTVQFHSVAQSCLTLWDPMACQATLSITNPWSLLNLTSIKSVMPFSHLILCCPLLLLPVIFPSIGVFSMSQFFARGGQSIGVSASTSSFQRIFRTDFL